MIQTRRQWLRAASVWPACLATGAARKDFWESKDPATWSSAEKRALLSQSPWAREGFVVMELDKDRRKSPDYGKTRPGGDLPDTRPGVPPGGVRSVPIGEAPPPAPSADPGQPVQFRVLARWESAKPVRLAGGPEAPELTGQFYVIRLRGLPLLARKAGPTEAARNPNEGLLQAIKENSRLERKDKPVIPCNHLFTGSGDTATEVLLFFSREEDPITPADKFVTLESRFAMFHLSIRFPLKEMMYRGELAL